MSFSIQKWLHNDRRFLFTFLIRGIPSLFEDGTVPLDAGIRVASEARYRKQMEVFSESNTPDDPLKKVTVLYHFTDRRNLTSIRELGGLYSLAKLREMKVDIPAPGGNQWSHDADAIKDLDCYIHLCFRSNDPMEHQAREEGRIGASVFLQIHPHVLYWNGVKFTDDVSNKSGVVIHPIQEAIKLIDFEVLYTRTDWNDPAIQQRLQCAEKCEILVPDHIPIKYIRNI